MACAAAADADDLLWPVEKLRGALSGRRGPAPAGPGGPVVVLTTGAMNPPHRGHVQLLHQAARRLERAGYDVAGMWVSPSHDGYVQPKARSLKTVGLSAAFRLEVARRCAAADPVVDVGAWEASQPGRWPDYPEVCRALQRRLAALPAGEAELLLRPARERSRSPGGSAGRPEPSRPAVRVFYACGADHASKCGLYRGLDPAGNIGVVVVPRAVDGDAVGPRGSAGGEQPDRLVYVAEAAEGAVAAVSSTKVRAALGRGDRAFLRQALPAGALELLLAPTAEEHARFQEDFRTLGVEPKQLRRKVYISLSSLMARCDREGEAVLHTIPPDALFLFGSKRSWVFPESAAEQEESRSENPRYTMAKYEGLRSLIVDKEARGEVFFLKPPGFKYSGDLFHGDPEAYQRTSAWLQGHLDPATDRHYSPLLLDPAWWQNEFQPGTAAYTSSVETITKNFPNGAHDYRPLMELLHQSNPTLDIVVP